MHNNMKIQTLWLVFKILLLKKLQLHSPEVHNFDLFFFLVIHVNITFWIGSNIKKVPRGIRGEKSSQDMASSRNLVSTIGALASPKKGDGTRCPEG